MPKSHAGASAGTEKTPQLTHSTASMAQSAAAVNASQRLLGGLVAETYVRAPGA